MTSTTTMPEYVGSNEPYEWERLDFQHQLLVRMFGGLYRAPLDVTKLKRVLDIGCGTGTWAIEFARKNPNIEVLGFDITDKPTWEDAPSNCKLVVADLELDDTWAALGTFDFIHGRFITPSVRNWPELLFRCHKHLNPGGFVEFQELAFPIGCVETYIPTNESAVLQWSEGSLEAWKRAGLEPRENTLMPNQLAEAGFEKTKLENFRMFIGPWAEDPEDKEIGKMGQRNLINGLPGFVEILWGKYMGWNKEEVEAFARKLQEDFEQPKLRTWLPVWTCHAEKLS